MLRSKILIPASALALMLAIGGGCKKSFLDENMITAKTSADYITPLGLDGLATGMYQNLRFHFNYEWAYTTTNYGVDEFTVGGDATMEMWNSYSNTLNSTTQNTRDVWDNMYGGINSANILIQNVPLYYGDGANKNTRLGEGYFVRAFNYFKLVNQYGGVPLKLTPSEGKLEFEFPRNTVQEVYDQIISDMTQAYNLLPATPAQRGRITKWAAAHYLAKIYLFRASEVNNSWNSSTKTADLDNAIKYGTDVINNSGHKLAANFSDLWNYTGPNSPNESNAEVILSAQFSDNTATQGRYGNQMHLYYLSVYQTLGGMVRDIAGGREYQRLRSTDYAVDVYDRVNDSRFWKSFKTRYLCNNPSGAPKWTKQYAPTPADSGKVKFKGGEDAVLYIVNNAGDTSYTVDTVNRRAPWYFVRYFRGEAENMAGTHGNYNASRFVGLSKFADGSRADVANTAGRRDGILARLADTYLMVAEAYGRKGKYTDALPFINAVRERAAYKAGEDRTAYVDGGVAYKTNTAANGATYVSYSGKNTYYESNHIPVATTSTFDAMHINNVNDILGSTSEFYDKLNVGSDADRFLNFILNERSRELMGELLRWEDLARTRTLVTRCTAFNPVARPVPTKDYLRPIPQNFLDVIKTDGLPLTADQKAAYQNPGW